ncbi:MAG: carbohydrate-binding protein [Provencibacterium sp.]|jgi:hypothetical protein|nr:carbohydrate-binding protein [Provencibacterium sp.]
MAALTLEIQNKEGKSLACASGGQAVSLVYTEAYQEGDSISLHSDRTGIYLILQLDDAMESEFVYLASSPLVYTIPFGEKHISYSPKAFYGDRHLLRARLASEDEIQVRKNLARNVYDQHGDPGLFPHAFANVETRGESVFAARNAIDGNCSNRSHGPWPYESWGINRQDDAEITLAFGRMVEIDRMVLVTRADFPHDNYWVRVTFTFSDGSTLVHEMEKSVEPHEIPLSEKKRVEWIRLSNLIKADDPSPFPALSQWEVYGVECPKN